MKSLISFITNPEALKLATQYKQQDDICINFLSRSDSFNNPVYATASQKRHKLMVQIYKLASKDAVLKDFLSNKALTDRTKVLQIAELAKEQSC